MEVERQLDFKKFLKLLNENNVKIFLRHGLIPFLTSTSAFDKRFLTKQNRRSIIKVWLFHNDLSHKQPDCLAKVSRIFDHNVFWLPLIKDTYTK